MNQKSFFIYIIGFSLFFLLVGQVKIVPPDLAFYYSFTRSIAYDLDFCFANDYESFEFGIHETYLTEEGYPANDWPMGTGIVWLPFLLIAKLVLLISSVFGYSAPPDGFSWFELWFVTFGSTILFGAGSLWISYRLCQIEKIDQHSSYWSIALIMIGSSFSYHLFVNSADSHAPSAFFIALFVLTWLKSKHEKSICYALISGISIGIAGLIRPHNVIFLLTPIIDYFLNKKTMRFRFFASHCSVIVISAFVTFFPQMLVWKELYGSWITLPRSSDVLWTQPQIYNTLFSDFHGLISWSPLFGFGLIGLFMQKKWLPYAIPLLIQLYIYSCNIAWWCGGSFGNRRMLGCTPFFILGLAYLFSYVSKSWLKCIAVICALWTFSILTAEVYGSIQLDHYQPWSEMLSAIKTGALPGIITLFSQVNWAEHGLQRVLVFLILFIVFIATYIFGRTFFQNKPERIAIGSLTLIVCILIACFASAIRSQEALEQADVNEYQKIDRFSWVVYFEYGYYCVKKGQFDDAMQNFLAACILEPRHPETWMYNAMITDRIGWEPLPYPLYREAFLHGKKSPEFLAAFETYLTRLIQKTPSADYYNQRGIIRLISKKFQWAKYDLEKALSLEPSHKNATYNLSIIDTHINGTPSPAHW
jgi:hypothetical protein